MRPASNVPSRRAGSLRLASTHGAGGTDQSRVLSSRSSSWQTWPPLSVRSPCCSTGVRSWQPGTSRGTGFAARDWQLRPFAAEVDGRATTVEVRVTTLPAYLLAKAHAAYGRGLTKDWYDIAYVVLHNDDGGPDAAAAQVQAVFGADLAGQTATALGELAANFADPSAQGSSAYASTMLGLHPDLDADLLANDAVAGISQFLAGLQIRQ